MHLKEFLKSNFQSIYVINLKHRTERLNKFKQRIKLQFDFLTKDIDELFNVFEAVNGKELKQLKSDTYFSRCKSNGEVGCHLSHRTIWKSILDNEAYDDSDLVLVFEDDAFFLKDISMFQKIFQEVIESFRKISDTNCKLLYLGGRFKEKFKPEKDPLLDNWRKKTEFLYQREIFQPLLKTQIDRTTHSYVLSKSCAKKLYEFSIKDSFDKPVAVDTFIQWVELKHNKDNSIVFYDCFPHICFSPDTIQRDVQKKS
jgi:GR25 family glycosyltransferase involved in LPS biosynthesis